MSSSPTPPEGLPQHWPAPLPATRVTPLRPGDLSAEAGEALAGMPTGPDGQVMNLFATLARHPRLLRRWSAFGGVLLARGELPARDRELAILRTAWNCHAHYEWVHHDAIGRLAGLTDEEIHRVTLGPDATGWPAGDALVLRAADELHDGARIGDGTWAGLAERYDDAQLIELCMLVGQYHLVAFTLNSLGVELEGHQES